MIHVDLRANLSCTEVQVKRVMHFEFFQSVSLAGLLYIAICIREMLHFCILRSNIHNTRAWILATNIYLLVARDICRTKAHAARIRRAPNLWRSWVWCSVISRCIPSMRPPSPPRRLCTPEPPLWTVIKYRIKPTHCNRVQIIKYIQWIARFNFSIQYLKNILLLTLRAVRIYTLYNRRCN